MPVNQTVAEWCVCRTGTVNYDSITRICVLLDLLQSHRLPLLPWARAGAGGNEMVRLN